MGGIPAWTARSPRIVLSSVPSPSTAAHADRSCSRENPVLWKVKRSVVWFSLWADAFHQKEWQFYSLKVTSSRIKMTSVFATTRSAKTEQQQKPEKRTYTESRASRYQLGRGNCMATVCQLNRKNEEYHIMQIWVLDLMETKHNGRF